MQIYNLETTYFTFNNLSAFPKLTNAVFTRRGGYSLPPYESLNLGLHVDDDKDTVISNRKKALGKLGFTIEDLISMEQTHGDNLQEVHKKDAGRGAYSRDDAIPKTDAMVCGDKGVILMALVADCAAVIFYSPEKEVIGIAHCGWRGTVSKLPVKVINYLKDNFKCNPSELFVGISPGIGCCCFEVQKDVFDLFCQNFPGNGISFFEQREGKLYLNLMKAINFQIKGSGVKEENIEALENCTHCRNDLFFSYRAEKGKTGRFAVCIGIKN